MKETLLLQAAGWKPYSTNTFTGNGKKLLVAYPIHHVSPHHVQGHFREGKFISGYWRDGDGNTKVNTYRGYYAKNPGAVPITLFAGKRGING